MPVIQELLLDFICKCGWKNNKAFAYRFYRPFTQQCTITNSSSLKNICSQSVDQKLWQTQRRIKLYFHCFMSTLHRQYIVVPFAYLLLLYTKFESMLLRAENAAVQARQFCAPKKKSGKQNFQICCITEWFLGFFESQIIRFIFTNEKK